MKKHFVPTNFLIMSTRNGHRQTQTATRSNSSETDTYQAKLTGRSPLVPLTTPDATGGSTPAPSSLPRPIGAPPISYCTSHRQYQVEEISTTGSYCTVADTCTVRPHCRAQPESKPAIGTALTSPHWCAITRSLTIYQAPRKLPCARHDRFDHECSMCYPCCPPALRFRSPACARAQSIVCCLC